MSILSAANLPKGLYRAPKVGRVDWIAIAIIVVLAALAFVALFPQLVAPYTATQTNILSASEGPSAAHLLGTDGLGRDILSRLIYGARDSLAGPAIIVVVSATAGTALSISAVWFGGVYRTIVNRCLDLLFAIPSLLIAILAVAFFGAGVVGPVVALSIAFTPYAARVIQSVAVRERELAYIESLELTGFGGFRICVSHLVPSVSRMIIAQITISFGSALVDIAAVSFLGLGVPPPSPAWGVMISSGLPELLGGRPSVVLSPAITILIVVVLVNLLGARIGARGDTKR